MHCVHWSTLGKPPSPEETPGAVTTAVTERAGFSGALEEELAKYSLTWSGARGATFLSGHPSVAWAFCSFAIADDFGGFDPLAVAVACPAVDRINDGTYLCWLFFFFFFFRWS